MVPLTGTARLRLVILFLFSEWGLVELVESEGKTEGSGAWECFEAVGGPEEGNVPEVVVGVAPSRGGRAELFAWSFSSSAILNRFLDGLPLPESSALLLG